MRPVENAELEADKRRLNRPVLNGRCLRAGACWRDAEVVDRRRSGGAALLRLTEEPFRVDGLPVKEPAWRDVAGRDGVVGRMGWVGKAATSWRQEPTTREARQEGAALPPPHPSSICVKAWDISSFDLAGLGPPGIVSYPPAAIRPESPQCLPPPSLRSRGFFSPG